MFEEIKEMIDSTIYTNGRGEVTAQNVNLAMHGMIGAVEDKVTELEQSGGNGESGALRWWLADESFGITATPEQTQENIATYNKLVEDKYASVILCYGLETSSFNVYTSMPVCVQYIVMGGETQIRMTASMVFAEGEATDCVAILANPDGTMDFLNWQQPSTPASSGPLRVWINEEKTPEQIAENISTYNAIQNGSPSSVCLAAEYEDVKVMYAVSMYESVAGVVSLLHSSRIISADGAEDVCTIAALYSNGGVHIGFTA